MSDKPYIKSLLGPEAHAILRWPDGFEGKPVFEITGLNVHCPTSHIAEVLEAVAEEYLKEAERLRNPPEDISKVVLENPLFDTSVYPLYNNTDY